MSSSLRTSTATSPRHTPDRKPPSTSRRRRRPLPRSCSQPPVGRSDDRSRTALLNLVAQSVLLAESESWCESSPPTETEAEADSDVDDDDEYSSSCDSSRIVSVSSAPSTPPLTPQTSFSHFFVDEKTPPKPSTLPLRSCPRPRYSLKTKLQRSNSVCVVSSSTPTTPVSSHVRPPHGPPVPVPVPHVPLFISSSFRFPARGLDDAALSPEDEDEVGGVGGVGGSGGSGGLFRRAHSLPESQQHHHQHQGGTGGDGGGCLDSSGSSGSGLSNTKNMMEKVMLNMMNGQDRDPYRDPYRPELCRSQSASVVLSPCGSGSVSTPCSPQSTSPNSKFKMTTKRSGSEGDVSSGVVGGGGTTGGTGVGGIEISTPLCRTTGNSYSFSVPRYSDASSDDEEQSSIASTTRGGGVSFVPDTDVIAYRSQIHLLQEQLQKTVCCARDAISENTALRKQLEALQSDSREMESTLIRRREKLEFKLRNETTKRRETELQRREFEERARSSEAEALSLSVRYEGVMKKNRELRDKLLRVARRLRKTKARMDVLSQERERFESEFDRCRRNLRTHSKRVKELRNENERLTKEYGDAETARTRLLAEKKILTRKVSESSLLHALGNSMSRSNAQDSIAARRRTIKPTKSCGQLKRMLLLKNTIRHTYVERSEKARATSSILRLIKVDRIRILSEMSRMMTAFGEAVRDVQCKVTLVIQEFAEQQLQQQQQQQDEALPSSPTSCLSPASSAAGLSESDGGSSRLSSPLDPLEYARIQAEVIQDLGLMEFYQSGALRPSRKGYLHIKGFLRGWRRFFVVVSSRRFSFSMYNRESDQACVKRFSLEDASLRKSGSGSASEFQLRFVGIRQVLTCRGQGAEGTSSWVGFLEGLLSSQ